MTFIYLLIQPSPPPPQAILRHKRNCLSPPPPSPPPPPPASSPSVDPSVVSTVLLFLNFPPEPFFHTRFLICFSILCCVVALVQSGPPETPFDPIIYHAVVPDQITFILSFFKTTIAGVLVNRVKIKRYEGDWVDGMCDGYGVETWVKGSRYRGQYRQGLRHGLGVYRFYTGDVYAGEWSNGRSHGCGVHSCEDGSRYAGEFKWGVKHGLGYYHFRNGDAYAGEYFADKMHGFGVYNFANGHRYEGSWHEGKRQGFGVYTFRNGETQSGHWQNGVLESSPPLLDYRSKVVNAIQEARCAAEKAYEAAGKMEERVNNVVISANKAANAARVAAIKAVQKQIHQRRNSDELPIPMVQNIHHLPTQLTV
ncbi:hypothetical protein E3N88_36620 [Mikania micrantha]|uniref:Uncharacterized protein n=1 Tax=Mikania micrantha TaxID=192012 RepID=A0A5N6M469_9ASTR|nr:hypothetical protein E3N88_36620 [Mikania micrantha]